MKFIAWVVFACALLVSMGCYGGGPNPSFNEGSSDRFLDNGDGTVWDRGTGLVWLKNANCFGQQNWDTALASVAALRSGDCGLTDGTLPGSWRLPTADCAADFCQPIDAATGEFPSIFNSAACNAAPYVVNATGRACSTVEPISRFSGVQSGVYWSSSTFGPSPEKAFSLDLVGGHVSPLDKTTTFYVWPVRGGQ